MENDNELTPFEGKGIRKVWHDEQWYFSITDVIEVLTDTPSPSQYWGKIKSRDKQLLPTWLKLKLLAPDGKMRLTDCANTQGILRIIMSVPSFKAEPFKLWLAQVGTERIEEMEKPEIGIARNLDYYKAKGYSDEWITQRLESITARNKLTEEWKNRGVKKGQEYSILTAIISEGTFGVKPSEHKKLKGLEKPSQDLRDNMTALELIFTQLGEETTRFLAVKENAQGFNENKDKAIKGGKAAGKSLETYEAETGIKVLSSENFLKPLKGGDKPDELPEGDKVD
jgi:DNA-damage-inducible protein D